MNIKIRQPQCFSEIGKKDNQEDYLWPMPADATEANRVFLMCDGVGGHEGGEVASQTAATALGTYLTEHPSDDGVVTKDLFEAALSFAYDELDKVDNGAAKKMGTTMTCLVLHAGGAMVAHIGDSRIYHIRPALADGKGRTGIIYQSADHSLVNDLLRVGEITEEEAVNFPQKNVITRAMQPHLERRSKADIYTIEDVQAGDYFFLCCDGVLEQLTNDRLGEILSDSALDDSGKIKAIKEVCDGKTRDNYSCWLVPVDAVEGKAASSDAENVVVAVVEEANGPVVEDAPTVKKIKQVRKHTAKFPVLKVIIYAVLIIGLILLGCYGKSWLAGKDKKLQEKETTTEKTERWTIGEVSITDEPVEDEKVDDSTASVSDSSDRRWTRKKKNQTNNDKKREHRKWKEQQTEE